MAASKPDTNIESLVSELGTLVERIKTVEASSNIQATKRARIVLNEITEQLTSVVTRLDPVLKPESVFDPAEPKTAGRIIALAMVAQAKHPLAAIPEFYGSGIYAIYYNGDFAPYSGIAGKEHPIYVGKADPSSGSAKDAVAQGSKLSARLAEHAKSIRKAKTTLDLSDFECRFLIVQTGFQKSAEDYLITFFRPIWNSETKICFGLGKHGDSSETRGNKRSPWDTMHPGRVWADSTAEDQKSASHIIAQIDQHLIKHPPYKDIHEIFDKFMTDMRQLNPENFHTPVKGRIVVEKSP